jgi:hypothetical protein
MQGFNIGRYLLRVVKYIFFYAILIFLMLVVVYFTSNQQDITFWELIRPESQTNLIILIVAFSVVYPFIGFSKQKIYTNRPFNQDKDAVIRIITESGFIPASDTDGKLVFKAKRISMRIFRVFEDKITLDYTDNPLAMEGMRRDVQRIARHLEHYFRSEKHTPDNNKRKSGE